MADNPYPLASAVRLNYLPRDTVRAAATSVDLIDAWWRGWTRQVQVALDTPPMWGLIYRRDEPVVDRDGHATDYWLGLVVARDISRVDRDGEHPRVWAECTERDRRMVLEVANDHHLVFGTSLLDLIEEMWRRRGEDTALFAETVPLLLAACAGPQADQARLLFALSEGIAAPRR